MPTAIQPAPTDDGTATAGAAAASADAWLQLDRQLCFALYSCSRAMTRAYQPLLQPLGLTYPQYLALLVLWEGDGISVHQLGERLGLDSGTLTPLLKRLADRGWVSRVRDLADERRVRLHLTAEGRALKDRARPIPPAILQASACAAGDLAALRAQLQDLQRRLAASTPFPTHPDTQESA